MSKSVQIIEYTLKEKIGIILMYIASLILFILICIMTWKAISLLFTTLNLLKFLGGSILLYVLGLISLYKKNKD